MIHGNSHCLLMSISGNILRSKNESSDFDTVLCITCIFRMYGLFSIFPQFSCCGVDSGRDFEFSRFNRDFTLKVFNQTVLLSNLQTPLACCSSASRTTFYEPGACAKYPIQRELTHYFEVNYITWISTMYTPSPFRKRLVNKEGQVQISISNVAQNIDQVIM